MQNLKDYAYSLVGIPYKWGGKHPKEGYDCSGLIQELMRSVGQDPPKDQSAQALFDHFAVKGSWNKLGVGSLLFFGRSPKRITHVAMAIDQYRMIEAGGGGRHVKTIDDAIAAEAFVRVRLIKSRRDLQAIIKPDFSRIGMI